MNHNDFYGPGLDRLLDALGCRIPNERHTTSGTMLCTEADRERYILWRLLCDTDEPVVFPGQADARRNHTPHAP